MPTPSSFNHSAHKPSLNSRVITSSKGVASPSSPRKPQTSHGITQHPDGERLSKIMAERGICSRREADSFIEQGLVLVDGVRINQLGTRIQATAKIVLDKSAQQHQENQRTIILHKPVGYVSGQPEPGMTPAVTLIRVENYFQTPRHPPINQQAVWSALRGLAPAGRLDVDSTGLLVLTQDGRIARQLIGDDTHVDKEYLVRVDRLPNANALKQLCHGLSLDGKLLRPAKVTIENDDQLMFVLREGRKRQIRRMCELVGLRVVGLKRVRIGRLRLGNLPLGQWRFLALGEGF